MPEKLLNLKEAAELLGVDEGEVKKLVESDEIPAYKIGGQFLRFRKEQLEAIADEVRSEAPSATVHKRGYQKNPAPGGEDNLLGRIADFFYFSDFYIASFVLILVMTYFIFRR